MNTSAANTVANDMTRLKSSNYCDQNKSVSYLLHNKRLICKGVVQCKPPTQICRKQQAGTKSRLAPEQTEKCQQLQLMHANYIKSQKTVLRMDMLRTLSCL